MKQRVNRLLLNDELPSIAASCADCVRISAGNRRSGHRNGPLPFAMLQLSWDGAAVNRLGWSDIGKSTYWKRVLKDYKLSLAAS